MAVEECALVKIAAFFKDNSQLGIRGVLMIIVFASAIKVRLLTILSV
jgi:hypothetical protein